MFGAWCSLVQDPFAAIDWINGLSYLGERHILLIYYAFSL